MSFAWTPELAVGVEAIDAQHRELFARVDALLRAAREGRGPVEALHVLGFLGEYVVEHFALEEALMRDGAYPGFAAHRAEHAALERRFAALRTSFARGGADDALAEAVEAELGGWLVRHVSGTDRALGAWYAALPGRAGDERRAGGGDQRPAAADSSARSASPGSAPAKR
jgi:hemerythrin